ncbi:MAG: hypothetical protein IJU98_11490 [Synergistaceae bacterium]|nr:hypothetical protein [Synergistaceae bacterium]
MESVDDAGLFGSEPEAPETAARERLKKAVKADIKRANSFFTEKCEPVLRTRHQVYDADVKYYRRKFSLASKQSEFVSYDFWSMVQWAIPAVMNSFFGGGDAIAIVGRNPEDVPRAEVMKALIEFQVMVQNKGFIRLWDWFSDAFQYGLGALKVWWKREEEWDEETLETVDPMNLARLLNDPWCQVSDARGPDLWGNYAVSYRVGRVKENRPVIEPVRVTDLRWSPEARSLEEANFVAQRKIVTADHLRRQARTGLYDADAVERVCENKADRVVWNSFETELNDESDRTRDAEEDPARAQFELYECYVKLDIDGDGLLEDAIVTAVDEEILRVEENPWGRAPIFTLAPIRDPFRVLAQKSFAEIVGEIQDIKTVLTRQIVANTVMANNPRFFLDHTAVNPDDLLNGEQYVRVNGPDMGRAILPFPTASVAPWTMNFIELLEGAMEQYTGRTRYNQGTDGKSLNKTATGISLLQQASEQRIDYIVRAFAETGVGEMMRFLVGLNQRYIDQAQVIRLENQALPISPDDLTGEFDIDVNTEAGVGKKKQTIQNLQFYLTAIAPTGMQIGAVTPGEWAKAATKLLQESGIRDPQSYVLDPEIAKQQFYQAMIQQMAAQAAQQASGAAAQGGGMGNGGNTEDGGLPQGGVARAALGDGGGGPDGVL